MQWSRLKAELLSIGTTRLTGNPPDEYISRSTAGPSAGETGSVFFSVDGRRVRLAINPDSTIEVHYKSGEEAVLSKGDMRVRGRLEPVALHCPRQAYITVTGRCIFRCRYCPVPAEMGRRKSIEEILEMVGHVRNEIDAISITSGVAEDIEEEEEYVLDVVAALMPLGLPVGVSIYPLERTPDRLHALGVFEVKFNLEAATEAIFRDMCPGLDWDLIWRVLKRSVTFFGRGRVFSNVIIGLGETDEEMEGCIYSLTRMGVIPVLRPLNPVAGLAGWERPSADRLIRLAKIHEKALSEAGLDPGQAITMCSACTGCDLVPGRDT